MNHIANNEPISIATAYRIARQTVLQMLPIIENPKSSDEDKARAAHTIRDAFEVAESPQGLGSLVASQSLAQAVRFERPDADSQLRSQETAFWTRVQQLMKSKAVTQLQLADKLGTTQPAISQLLNRRCRPQRSTILNIASALGVEPRDLWPEMEVANILDSVAAFHEEQQMTVSEAAAIQRTLERAAPDAPAAPLPKRKR